MIPIDVKDIKIGMNIIAIHRGLGNKDQGIVTDITTTSLVCFRNESSGYGYNYRDFFLSYPDTNTTKLVYT